MDLNKLNFPGDHLFKTASGFHVLLGLTIFLVYGQLLAIGHRFPEYPNFYMMNQDFEWKDWFRVYNPFQGGWYRPTAFYLYFHIVSPIVGWHNFAGFQWIAFLTQFALGSMTWLFARKTLRFDDLTSAISGLFVAIHPVFFMLAVDLFNFDALYQLFILGASIIWMLDGRFTLIRLLGFLLLSFLALTSKEQAVVLPGFLLLVFVLRGLPERRWKQKLDPLRMAGFLIVLACSLILLATRIFYMRDASDGSYRTGMDMGVVTENILAGITWIFRLFLFDAPTWASVRSLLFHPAGFVVGIGLAASAAYYIIFVLRRRKELNALILILGLMVIFMFLPVYSGGRPWHFGLPAIGAMLLAGRGLTLFLERIPVGKPGRGAILASIVVLVICCSTWELYQDQQRRQGSTRVLKEAMERPPIEGYKIPPGATILYEIKDANAAWMYSWGDLFRYVYLRPDLKERAVLSFKDMRHEELQKLNELDSLFVFDYNHGVSPAWKNISSAIIPSFKAMAEGKPPAAPGSIELGEGRMNNYYLSGGWSAPEGWGRWTDGKSASVNLSVPELDTQRVRLVTRFVPFISESHPKLKVSVHLGEKELDRWELNWPEDGQMHNRSVPLPPSLRAGEVLDITYRVENPATPQSVDTASTDSRMLGLGVERIWIESAD